jgi:sRNA-binding protein
VFEIGNDPIQLGLVDSLNRPGGNVTGANQMNIEVAPKLAKRKKRAKVQKRAKRRSSAKRDKAKSAKAAKATKRTVARTKPKPAPVKKAAPKVVRRVKKPVVETVVVDLIEQPAPGVITVTEVEETVVRQQSPGSR